MSALGTLLALAALGGEPRFVPGEVIVAFKRDTEPGGITSALAKGEAAAQGRLDAYVATLSSRLGIPLKTKRVGSGGDVLMEVDRRELSSRLISQLRLDSRVVGAAPAEVGEEVRVQFGPGSREAREVAKAPVGKPEREVALPEITRSLAKDLGLALTSRITPKREFLVAVDARALTLSLVERLRALPEVEYTQPNFLVHKLGP